MLCPDPEHTVGQWFRWAAAWRCVRHSSTFVSAPVGLDGRQPGNYTALTTSPERKAHCHTHTYTYLYVSIQIIQPHLHSQYLSPICSPPHTHTHTYTYTQGPRQTQGLHYVKEDYNDSNVTRLRSCSASGVSVPEFTV